MDAALQVLRYLKGTPDVGIYLNNSPNFSLVGCCDSAWVACPDSRLPVTGFCVSLGGNLLSWKSKKQPVVSLSFAEAKYRVVSKFVAELSWLVHLLFDFGLTVDRGIPILCDSQAAIHIAKNPVFH